EGAPPAPAGGNTVAQRADNRVVDGIPHDAEQRGKRGQPRRQPDHVRQENGVEDLADRVEARHAPVAGAVDELRQQWHSLFIACAGVVSWLCWWNGMWLSFSHVSAPAAPHSTALSLPNTACSDAWLRGRCAGRASASERGRLFALAWSPQSNGGVFAAR